MRKEPPQFTTFVDLRIIHPLATVLEYLTMHGYTQLCMIQQILNAGEQR